MLRLIFKSGDERSAMKHGVCLHWYATAFVVSTPALSDLFFCWQVNIFITPTEMLAEGKEERERENQADRERERETETETERERKRERHARERGARERCERERCEREVCASEGYACV